METKTTIVIISAQMRSGQMLCGGGPVNGSYRCELHVYKEDQRPFYLHLLQLNKTPPPYSHVIQFLVSHILLSISAACRAKNLSGPKLERMKKLLVPTTTASSSRESLAWWCWWLAGAEPKPKSKYNKGEIVRRLSWAQCKCCTPLGKPSLSAPAVGILCLFATSTNVF